MNSNRSVSGTGDSGRGDLTRPDGGTFASPLFRRLLFVARAMKAASASAGPRLVWQGAADRFDAIRLSEERTIFAGRAPESDIRLEDERLSRLHFSVESGSRGPVLKDLGSRNGTRVNGRRTTSRLLLDGDVIEAGRQAFVYLAR